MTPAAPSPPLTAAGRFADPAGEAAYRLARLADARALGRQLVLSVAALDAVFLPLDVYFRGVGPAVLAATGVRLAVSVWCLACWWRLGRAATPAGVERTVGVWAPPAVGLNMAVLLVLPGDHTGAAAAFAVSVVLAYLLPLPLAWCGGTGLLVTAGFLGVLASRGGLPAVTVCGFVMANVLGASTARHMRRGARRQYAAAAALAEAAAELRTLRGLLPICAFCKQIRDDAGHWHRLEGYIQARTPARFSHGVCPGCLHAEYGLTAPAEVTRR